MATIYYNERIHTTQKGEWDKAQGNQEPTSNGSVPLESHRMCLTPVTTCWDNTWSVIYQSSSLGTQCSKCFGDWSYRHSLPHTFHNPRLPDRKQTFSINHIVCTISVGTVNHSSVRVVGTSPNPSYQMTAKEEPCKQTTAVRPAIVTLS